MALTKVRRGGTDTGISDSSDATAITIDSSENVGIGTSSPSGLAHVYNGMLQVGSKTGDTSVQQNTNAIRIAAVPNSTTEWGGLQWYREFSDYIGAEIIASRPSSAESDTDLIFKTSTSDANATERMRIDSSGNLMVAKTSVASSSVGFEARANGFNAFTRDGGQPLEIRRLSSDGVLIDLRKDGSTVGSISVSGSSTAYNTSSDYRLKENIVTDWDATTRLKQLKPSRFNFKVDKDKTVDGFIAHEVSNIVPEAISGEKDAVDSNGEMIPQGIDQSKLVPLLVKTIQELEARIATLESK